MGSPTERLHTFLFADLAGYTALTEAMGDEEAADLAADFCSRARQLLPAHGAEEVKAIGDALMIRVDEAGRAIHLGLRIVNEIGGGHHFPIVRAGMHTGPAIQRNRDWYGGTVNLAARVSGVAAGGEVLLTEATRHRAEGLEDIELRERGRRTLRNIAEPALLYAALAKGELDDTGLPIDPVCRMAVDPEHAAGSLTYAGTEHYFCSLECAARFAARPESYQS
ncbi:MAG: YHS domain-containing protein [Thermoleophilaceae bacterium]|nr:YHS domain-containing protein [Thermoleophilaceae bacterium]